MELKIKLKVKDVEIELTREEALELKDLLDKLCIKKTEYVPYYPTYPIQPTYPWYTGPPWPEVTWVSDNTDWTTCKIGEAIQLSYANS